MALDLSRLEPALRFAPELLLQAQGRGLGMKAAVFDVDGVLTDGRLYIAESGEQFKAFHSLDGHGLKLLAQAGIVPIICTGRDSPAVRRRVADLGLQLIRQRPIENDPVPFPPLGGNDPNRRNRPLPQALVGTARVKRLVVGREGQCVNDTGMASECFEFLAQCQIPNADDAVIPRRGQEFAVGRVGDELHRLVERRLPGFRRGEIRFGLFADGGTGVEDRFCLRPLLGPGLQAIGALVSGLC